MAGVISRSSSVLLRSAAKLVKSGQASATESLNFVRASKQMHTRCRGLLATQTQLQSYSCKRWTSEQATGESVDTEFSRFLAEEMQREQEIEKSRPNVSKIEGWESEYKGTDIILTKSRKNEKIVVKLNIVDSIDVADSEEDIGDEKMKMESRPPFMVEVHKGEKIVTFACQYPDHDEMGDDPEEGPTETMGDKFQILEIASHVGEVKENAYTVQSSTMDANMYELCMDYLDERGIDDQFMDQLVQFCTSYEHTQYIKFLGDFKAFVDTK